MTQFTPDLWRCASVLAPRDRRCAGTVLLAEDEEMVRRITSRMLAKLGYDVVAVRDGREALGALAEDHGTLTMALVDLRMPEVDGREVLRRIRERHPGLPVILMTGDSGPMPGCPVPDAWLAKPFSVGDLAEALGVVGTRP